MVTNAGVGRGALAFARRAAGVAAVGLLILAASCGHTAGQGREQSARPEEPLQRAPRTAAELPDTPAGRQTAWLLDAALGDGDPARFHEGRRKHVAPYLLQGHSDPAFHEQVDALAEAIPAPKSVHVIDALSSDHFVTALVPAGPIRFHISVADRAPHRIDWLQWQPAPLHATDLPQTWDALDAELRALAPQTQIHAAVVSDGSCQAIYERGAHRTMPIGSTFKLYVLHAYADAVARGEAAWSDEIPIRSEWKSLPSGTMHEQPEGKRFAATHYAKRMITRSDNTATDHLMHTLGRKTVEATVEATGHHRPEKTFPFLYTRELFWIRSEASREQIERYKHASVGGKRRFLDEVVAPAPRVEPERFRQRTSEGTGAVDTAEWFASGRDLCRVLASLQAKREVSAYVPALEALGAINGQPYAFWLDPDTWSYAGAKGGYEPGVNNWTWLLQRKDGRWFALSVGARGTASQVGGDRGEFTVWRPAAAAIRLLAR